MSLDNAKSNWAQAFDALMLNYTNKGVKQESANCSGYVWGVSPTLPPERSDEEIMNDFESFQQMLKSAKQSYRVNYCRAEVVPVWEIMLETPGETGSCSFTFTQDGKLVNTCCL